MGNISLTLACGPYDHMEALSRGIARAEGIDITFLGIQSPPEIFARQIKTDAFDISEMSLSLYLTLRAGGNFPYIALPVFPARAFRHAYIFVNRDFSISTPKDLEGKRIGVQQYRQTAASWIRGLLHNEYDVDLSTCTWVEGGVNAPRPPDKDMDLRPSDEIDIASAPAGQSINDLLISGNVAAYFGARAPRSLATHKNIDRLFPDYRDVERAYYKKTGIYPIMHTLVIRESLHLEKPWVAENIVQACQESKRWALSHMRFTGTMRYMVPWLNHEVEEIDALFGGDPYPYGIEPNIKTIETLMQYLVEQGFIAAPSPDVRNMFVPIVAWSE